jgi:membrane-associated protein
MSDLSDTFLAGMLIYGAPALSAALLLSGLGVPLPGAMLLLAAGAFVSQGALDGQLVVPLALVAVIAGDSGSYCLGRYAGPLVVRRVEGTATWRRAQAVFVRRGGVAMFLTRFLLTPLALPTNLIAGSSRYPYRRFLFFSVTGEVIWVAVYGALGYLFADSWDVLSDLLGNVSGLLVGVVLLAVAGYAALRYARRPREAIHLRQEVDEASSSG